MRKLLTILLATGIATLFAVSTSLALYIDFDDAVNNEVIDTKYAPEMTLASITNFDGILTSMPVDTGTNVEANVSGYSIGVSSNSFQGILLSFLNPMSSVSILGFDWGGDSTSDNETMYLSAFDSIGNFLGGDSFAGLYDNPNTRLGTLTFDNIAHVAFTFGSTTLGYYGIDYVDATEMQNAPVPEPATILLLAGGLAGLGWNLRRRKKA
jgi:hypothetical protein